MKKDLNPVDSARLLSERELGRLLHVSVTTVRNWRARNEGPAHLKLPRRSGRVVVRYRLEDVQDWLSQCERVVPPKPDAVKQLLVTMARAALSKRHSA